MNPRPEGYDYKKPDPKETRCKACNIDGMNRTGLVPISYIETSTVCMYAVRCLQLCQDGLTKEKK